MATVQSLKNLSEMPQLESHADAAVEAEVPNEENQRNRQEKLPKGKQAPARRCQKEGSHCLLCAW